MQGVHVRVPQWKILPRGQKESRGALAGGGFVWRLIFGKGWCMIAESSSWSIYEPANDLLKEYVISFIFLTIAISTYYIVDTPLYHH